MSANGHVRAKVQQAPQDHRQLSWWILLWFYVTAIVCTWDASFIMLRPYSMPGGSLAFIWYFYKYYITVDQRYQDVEDAYVFAQSLLNYGEVLINIVAIIMHYRCSQHTVRTAFMVSVMTFWKTVLYFLMFTDFCTSSAYRLGNTALQEFFIVFIPNVIWVVVPLAIMVVLWEQLTPQGQVKVMDNNAADTTKVFGNFHTNGYAHGDADCGQGVVNRKNKRSQ